MRVIARFWKSRWASYILVLLIFSFFCEGLIFKDVSAQPNSISEVAPLKIQARAAILVNADTGQILYEYNIHERFPHASLTKIMTLLIAMDALDNGEINLTNVVTISKEASDVVGSRIWLSEGDKISVEDLMKAIAVPSANDASYALAQHIAGSEENFVRMMNDKAKAMDLKDTHFQDSTGLSSLDHYSSAYDLYLQSRELILKHPLILDWTSRWLIKIEAKNYSYANTNRLVNPYESYEGLDGLKTGHTEEAQWCLVATAKKANVRLISVILGADSEETRMSETRRLLDYGFYNFRSISFKDGEVVGSVSIPLGREEKVDAVMKETMTFLIPKGKDDSEIVKEIELVKGLKAPVAKGEKIGELVVYDEGREIIRGEVVAAEDVERANIFVIIFRWIRDFIKGLISKEAA